MRCPQCHRRLLSKALCQTHGTAPAESAVTEAHLPQRVPGFQLLRLIGQGGFAQVFAARSSAGPTFHSEVAVKVAHGPTQDRFAREARVLRRLGPPVVPELLGEGQTEEGNPYLVLELLRGESLADWLARLPGNGVAALSDALERFVRLCESVQKIHQARIVHRDLKPENVFLQPAGLRLIDFGLARFEGEEPSGEQPTPEITRTGQRLGTAHYMAPEQCLDARAAGPQTDIYSLGVILFELLTARPPFVGDYAQVLQAHVARKPPNPSTLAAVPQALEQTVLRCLAKDPSSRFGSVQELIERLAIQERVPSLSENATQEATQATSVLARRPVALLGVRSRAPIDEICAIAAQEGGKLTRAKARQYLFDFVESSTGELGLRNALRAAKSMAKALRAALVVHQAEVWVREQRGERSVAGAVLDHCEKWWPPTPERGLWATPEVAALLGGEAAGQGERRLVLLHLPSEQPRDESSVPLRGREELLASLLGDAKRSWSERLPTLTTLLGDVGHGKTRMIEALCTSAADITSVQLLRLKSSPGSEEFDPSLRLLLRQVFELPANASADQVRVSCQEWLESSTAESSWLAIALNLGAISKEDRRVAQLLASPGAARHLLAKAIGEGLKHKAQLQPLAVLLDDAQWADPTTLDALEIATLSGDSAALWICVAALPSLLAIRPFWGERAGANIRRTLPPLDPEATRTLLRELLSPVEFVPESVLARIEEVTQGVPLSLIELVRALRADGAIRQLPGDGAWYVASDELLRPSVTPLHEQIAGRILAALAPPLRALAQLCAALGNDLSIAEVGAAQELFGRTEGSLAASEEHLDPRIGLDRLERAGLIRAVGAEKYVFRHPQLREPVEALTPPAIRRRIHRTLLARAKSVAPDPSALRRIARHAEACGAAADAFAAHFEIAESARLNHLHVEADQHFTAALAQLNEGDDVRRASCLAGRGKVRYRLQRFPEALQDLRAAREIADHSGSIPEVADLLLEEATVLYWLQDLEGAAKLVEQATPVAKRIQDPRIKVRCDLGIARTYVQKGQMALAAALLPSVAERARALGDNESCVIALVVLGYALLDLDLASAESPFEEAIHLCKSTGDHFHLGAAYANRVLFWFKRRDSERAIEDLRQAVRLAREFGYAQIEWFASYNLAESLFYQGAPDEAFPLARRVLELGERFFSAHTGSLDALLLARIAFAIGDLAECRRQMDLIAGQEQQKLSLGSRTLHRLIDLLLKKPWHLDGMLPISQGEWANWEQLIVEAKQYCSNDERVEVLAYAVSVAVRSGRSKEAADLLRELPNLTIVSKRFWTRLKIPELVACKATTQS